LEERAAEQQHYGMLMTLSGRPDNLPQVKVSIATPASDWRLSDAVRVPELGEPPDDQTVLQHAKGCEHLGMDHCRNLADRAQAGLVEDLFGYLAN
jgi:hypothetical protein